VKCQPNESTIGGLAAMQVSSRIEEQKIRNALKTKRSLLFADFSNNPSNICLALEIKLLDDRIADLDSSLRTKAPGDPFSPHSVVQ
jgi:hypothetical protein